jgi:hypothetical protein
MKVIVQMAHPLGVDLGTDCQVVGLGIKGNRRAFQITSG